MVEVNRLHGQEFSPKKELERQGKLAWVLSPGFLRGWLQFGVMDRLDGMGLYPDLVVGTSIGSWVGFAAGAARVPVKEIEERQKSEPETAKSMFMQKNFSSRGLFNLDHSMAVLGKLRPGYIAFEDLPVPFYVCATRNGDFEPVVFKSGPVLPAIKASVSVPPYFAPVEIDGIEYLDGGLTNPAPIDVAKANGATHVIYIDSYTEVINLRKTGTVKSVSKPAELALSFLPVGNPRDLANGVTSYMIAKFLSIARPTIQEAPKWVLAVHNQLVRKSLEINHPDVHISLSEALSGDTAIEPLSNNSFENHSGYINKGRRAVDHFIGDLQKLKDSLYPSEISSSKGVL